MASTTIWSEQETEDLLQFYNDKRIELKLGNFGKGHWKQCAMHVNKNKHENDPHIKTGA